MTISEQNPKEFDKWAAESGHFYTASGEPAYTVIAKGTGKPRPTTLRDAKKLNLYPSVTTILQVAAKPGLQAWQLDQMMMAALTLPRVAGETEPEFVARVKADSKEQARKAAERGTELHGAIERYFAGEKHFEAFHLEVAELVAATILATFGGHVWRTERSFASPLGYGGKVDLHAPGLVLDVKTKDDDVSQVKLYEEHEMQLAAYAHGLGMPDARCAIVFVSRDKPQVCIREVDEVHKSFRMFCALLEYWKMSKGHYPAACGDARATR